MMLSLKRLTGLLALAVLLFACENTENTPEPESTTPLKRIRRIITTNVADTSYKAFQYDAEGRLSRISETGGFFSGTETRYSYQNGQLSTLEMYNGDGELIETYRLTFSDEGKMSRYEYDYEGELSEVIRFQYDQDGHLESATGTTDEMPFSLEANTDANGNITRIAVQVNDEPGNEAILTYDDQINPFEGVFTADLDIFNYFGANNTLTVSEIQTTEYAEIDNITFTYEYDADGYPTQILENDGFTTREHRIEYE